MRSFAGPTILFIALAAAACERGPERAADGGVQLTGGVIPGDSPSIAGIITSARTHELRGAAGDVSVDPDRPVSSVDSGLTGPLIDSTHQILVEERPAQASGSDKAWVTVRRDTPVVAADGTPIAHPWDSLAPGTRVRIWFEGPVRESYPVQADARIVVVEP